MLNYKTLEPDEKVIVDREMEDQFTVALKKAISKMKREVHIGARCANCFLKAKDCSCDLFTEEFNLNLVKEDDED